MKPLIVLALLWATIGFAVGYNVRDMRGDAKPPSLANQCSAPAPVEDRPLVTHPSTLNPPVIIGTGEQTKSLIELMKEQAAAAFMLSGGHSPSGKATILQVDEDGYAICSPERKPQHGDPPSDGRTYYRCGPDQSSWCTRDP